MHTKGNNVTFEQNTLHMGSVTVFFGAKNGKYPDGNQVLVTGKKARAAFDAPLSTRTHPQNVKDADMVLLSHVHEDHVAGLEPLAHLPLYAPAQDAPAMQSMQGMQAHLGYSPKVTKAMEKLLVEDFYFEPRPDTIAYQHHHYWDLGGGIGVRAIHTPGHTAGHSILMVEPEGIAFIGDIDLSSFGPYYGDACSNLSDFRHTLNTMAQLPAKAWITYHHKGVIFEQHTFLSLLNAFRRKLDRREHAILQAIPPRHGILLNQLLKQRFLYPTNHQAVYVNDVERITVLQHLAEMKEKGLVHQEGMRYTRA